ncbi:MAG: polyprenyl synthetase family protein [Firmicutes bacterium]|nr:polyprenyl synthetase family protein [Bacillota bacterium]
MESQALKARVPTISLFSEIEADLPRAEQYIEETLTAQDPLLVEIATHLLKAGGKRLRPALVMLAAKVHRYDLERILPVATAVELIHMATLVHDDVVDHSQLRRGRPTVNAKWSDAYSVLVGDYLFARAFQLLADTGNNQVVRVMADVVYQMSTGEIQQIATTFKADQTEEDYYGRIAKKTALFLAESCRLGGLVSGASEEAVEALAQYGYSLGMSFQIVDDILDFTASAPTLGKPIGSDLRAGILTLPVLHALKTSPRAETLRRMIENRAAGDEEARSASDIIRENGSLEYAYQTAHRFVQQAKDRLSLLPPGPAVNNLAVVADFVVDRAF